MTDFKDPSISSEDLQKDIEDMRNKKIHIEDALVNIKIKKEQRSLIERSTQKTIGVANQVAKIDEEINKLYGKLFRGILK